MGRDFFGKNTMVKTKSKMCGKMDWILHGKDDTLIEQS